MVNNFTKKKFIIILFLTFSIFQLFSQEIIQEENNENNIDENAFVTQTIFEANSSTPEQNTSFLWEDENGETQIKQKFVWEKSDFVLKYVFSIEQLEISKKSKDVEYKHLNIIETENNYVELMLSAGTYRYKIDIYDLLGNLAYQTQWFPVEIIKAYQPKISGISPTTIYLEEIQDGFFSIDGSNLLENTEYYFYNEEELISIPASITDLDKNNKHVKIYIDPKLLDSNNYVLIATNPGGLQDKQTEIQVKFKKTLDIDVSGGWICPIILFDNTFPYYFDSNYFLLGGTAKISIIPFKHSFGYFGAGLETSYSLLKNDFNSYNINSNYINCYLNFIYQMPIRKKVKNDQTKQILTLEVHGGPGFTFLNNCNFKFNNGIETPKFNSLNFGFDAGGAVAVYLTNRLFLELNMDFTMTFMPSITLGTLTPSLCVGWQF